jgi:hypothetical protein
MLNGGAGAVFRHGVELLSQMSKRHLKATGAVVPILWPREVPCRLAQRKYGFLAPTFSQPRQAKTDLLVNLMAILRNQIEHLFNVVALLKIKRMLTCGGLILIRSS